jgi:hypothetical protein
VALRNREESQIYQQAGVGQAGLRRDEEAQGRTFLLLRIVRQERKEEGHGVRVLLQRVYQHRPMLQRLLWLL